MADVTFEKELARVERIGIEIEDHGCLAFSMRLDFGGAVQGLGLILDTYDAAAKRRVGTATGTTVLVRVLELFKVSTLEAIRGRTVFALYAQPRRHNDGIKGLELPSFDGGERLVFADLFPKDGAR